ncbi:MAG: hypothetical protein ACFFAS_09715 [Promethearchaeota archaeon]
MVVKDEKKKKSNFLGFRLFKSDIDKLDQISKIENKSRGLIAKQAVKNWLNLESFRKTNNMVIITKWTFFKLLAQADDSLIESIVAEMSSLLSDMTKFNVAKPMDINHFGNYSKNLIKFLGVGGLRWFNSINIILEKKKLIVKGLHDLDEHFSDLFMRIIEDYIANNFEFNIENDQKEISSNLVYLEYIVTL